MRVTLEPKELLVNHVTGISTMHSRYDTFNAWAIIQMSTKSKVTLEYSTGLRAMSLKKIGLSMTAMDAVLEIFCEVHLLKLVQE
jgi:hypothetical protein